MEQELVSPCSKYEGSGNTTLLSYLDELCPTYLMYGMTYEQYWYQDAYLAVIYREKFKLEREYENQKLWLQGAYVYNALCCVAPLFNSLKPKEPVKYMSEPIPLDEEALKQQEQRKQSEDIKAYMNSFMTKLNMEKEGENG